MRLLPWIQEQASRDRDSVAHLLDCEKCKSNYSAEERRRIMSCGFEIDSVADQTQDIAPRWNHPGYGGADPSCCAGYLIRQPDVIAISRLKLHWPAAPVRDQRARVLVEELEIQSNAAQGYAQREAAAKIRARSERPQ